MQGYEMERRELEIKVLACEIVVRRLVQEAKEKQYKITCMSYPGPSHKG